MGIESAVARSPRPRMRGRAPLAAYMLALVTLFAVVAGVLLEAVRAALTPPPAPP